MVEFVNKDPVQGGVKDVYFHPQKQYAVAFYRRGLDSSGRERIDRLIGMYRERIFDNIGGKYWEKLFRWPERLVEFNGRIGIVVPFYASNFFFAKDSERYGAEKDGYWFASAKNFNKLVPQDEKGTLLSFIQACTRLSRAVKRLHAAGLAHTDLSYKNCLIDPKGGEICVIDIDGLVVPELFPPDVSGTPGLIAPEVVATEHLPSSDPNRFFPSILTDRHALSVLIYSYLFHRHPLRGSKVWDIDPAKQDTLEMGIKALFIEHPKDTTNRMVLRKNDADFLPWIDTVKLPYTIFGPYVTDLFNRAFIKGLHDPEERPTANEWEEGLVKTFDLLKPCLNPNCIKKWYVFDETKPPVCPFCGTKYQGEVPILILYSSRDGKKYDPDNHCIMIYNNQYLYQWHVNRTIFPNERITPEEAQPVGYFSFYNNQWLFVNQRLPNLRNVKTNTVIETGKAIPLVNGMRLRFSTLADSKEAEVSILKF
jgi:serine/threonine protein kinase